MKLSSEGKEAGDIGMYGEGRGGRCGRGGVMLLWERKGLRVKKAVR